MNQPKRTEWAMTEDEILQLRRIWQRKNGSQLLLRSVMQALGEEHDEEAAFWDALLDRLALPTEYRGRLRASHESCKLTLMEPIEEEKEEK